MSMVITCWLQIFWIFFATGPFTKHSARVVKNSIIFFLGEGNKEFFTCETTTTSWSLTARPWSKWWLKKRLRFFRGKAVVKLQVPGSYCFFLRKPFEMKVRFCSKMRVFFKKTLHRFLPCPGEGKKTQEMSILLLSCLKFQGGRLKVWLVNLPLPLLRIEGLWTFGFPQFICGGVR